jgi:hypothetical protein
VRGGTGVTVTGSGTATNPYIITSTATLEGAFVVVDTPTVDLAAVGSGTTDDPYVLTADATVSVEELTNVDVTGLAAGYVLAWNGTAWKATAPPVAPAGATNTAGGVLGIGSAADPVRAAVSGVWGQGPLAGLGSDSTIGSEIYVDSNGQLRTKSVDPSTLHITWANVDGKPATFPSTWAQVASKPTSFPGSWTTTTGRPRIRGGSLSVNCRAGQTVSVVISFPAGWFTSTPAIAATAHSTVPANVDGVGVLGNGTAGFTLYVHSTDTTARTFSWVAIQNGPAA